MDVMLSVKEAAALWKMSERRVNELCRAGRIEGAHKEGRQWLIPADAPKPANKRQKVGTSVPAPSVEKLVPIEEPVVSIEEPATVEEPVLELEEVSALVEVAEPVEEPVQKLPLPIGLSDYRVVSSDYYYVDKTLLIRDILDGESKFFLFTRPAQFGKTLNMDMLRTFFEKTSEDTAVYFQNKHIWACGSKYQRHQGNYPVISLSFAEVQSDTWEPVYEKLSKLFQEVFQTHIYLLECDGCSETEKTYYRRVLDGTVSYIELTNALASLSSMLERYHGVAPILFLDSYDTPLQQGQQFGYYDRVALFMRSLFVYGIKDNLHLSYAFLTGVLQAEKETVFGGRYLTVSSILDCTYSAYFGFTEEEVRGLLEYYNVSKNYEEVRAWYGGYQCGDTILYHPQSVLQYLSHNCIPQAFLGDICGETEVAFVGTLEALMRGETVQTHINANVMMPQAQNHPSVGYSFLLMHGYLSAVTSQLLYGADYMCEVTVPNQEIQTKFRVCANHEE